MSESTSTFNYIVSLVKLKNSHVAKMVSISAKTVNFEFENLMTKMFIYCIIIIEV